MKVCLIGEVFVDVSLRTKQTQTKMRLGGIVHAARALWAMEIPYSVGYFAPSYLDRHIESYLNAHDCEEIIKLGNVDGAPNVFLIEEVKEVANQGYTLILGDEATYDYNESAFEKLRQISFSDGLLFAGNFDISISAWKLSIEKLHVDVTNRISSVDDLERITTKISTLFVSTSSPLFKNTFKNNFEDFSSLFQKYCDQLVLKENRGGSRAIDYGSGTTAIAASQTRPIVHSVGVGDVYNVAYIVRIQQLSQNLAMTYSSWVAAEYASTTYPDDFKTNVARINNSQISELKALGGVYIPWESRKAINVYIAAPDFNFVDTSPIDEVANSLEYHNFSPRRPIKENGQMEENADKTRRQQIFSTDMVLLDSCQILVAVLIYNDPGTLIEIGLASARGLPVFVYDPFSIANNCMLTELPDLVSSDLDELIAEIFIATSKLQNIE
ncbi:nucleoside 2-deoxyribosyltransferase [Dyadobacter sp. CY323]|uniref:nucleoside 2-deoxyribosyltransferase n=1 Tax=Dyadobacter sp. CY323 TaxID=2907302 RepID=UPI001F30462C|nr:nucleoside 2-deoxyribosyltransferase [Dyadobacter sp. CY323]MCE6992930.1 nucleoside 2-deoxyribosyltransferase [Dyadobacter sp. CY323]